MENINKYFIILETLKYPTNFQEKEEFLVYNINIFKSHLKLNIEQLCNEKILQDIECIVSENDTKDWIFLSYCFYAIIMIKNNINFNSTTKEDIISARHLNDFFKLLKTISFIGILQNLPLKIRNHHVFKLYGENKYQKENIQQLNITLKVFNEILKIKAIISHSFTDTILLEIIAGIYTIKHVETYKNLLDNLFINKDQVKYFKCLLLLKELYPIEIQQKLHKSLLEKLIQPGGFIILGKCLIPSADTEINEILPHWKCYEAVARIVSHKGHNKIFHMSIITQIFNLIENSILSSTLDYLIPAGVVSLRQIYDINENYKIEIKKYIEKPLKKLIEPLDLLTGTIIMDNTEFKIFLKMLSSLFKPEAHKYLPSNILMPYIGILFDIHSQLPSDSNEQKDIVTIIVHILANRSTDELKIILKNIMFSETIKSNEFKKIHQRLLICYNDKNFEFSVVVIPEDCCNRRDFVCNLLNILKKCNNSILINNIFILLLKMLDEEMDSRKFKDTSEPDLLDEEEFNNIIANKFQSRISLLLCLEDLISHKSLYVQFHENESGILEFIKDLLEKRLSTDDISIDINDKTFSISLTLLQTLLESSSNKLYDRCFNIKKLLHKIKPKITCEIILNQINMVLGLYTNTIYPSLNDEEFQKIQLLLEDSHPYMKVYGISQLIKLLKDRNKNIISKSYAILALALKTLKDPDSYVFLSSIKLLVSLTNVLEFEVIENLCAEYLDKNKDIDYRLKMGEVILKITDELGPLSYKYKDILFNTFLSGCRQENNEIKTSSLSNLGSLCRLLSYQVYNVFQEILNTIENIAQTEKYLPAKRAGIMVFSQLLWGINNLLDFEEFLLPIYRLLKYIIENDEDTQTRIHATNGLKYLKDKCMSFFMSNRNFEKEIKIFDIKGEKEKSKNSNILELN